MSELESFKEIYRDAGNEKETVFSELVLAPRIAWGIRRNLILEALNCGVKPALVKDTVTSPARYAVIAKDEEVLEALVKVDPLTIAHDNDILLLSSTLKMAQWLCAHKASLYPHENLFENIISKGYDPALIGYYALRLPITSGAIEALMKRKYYSFGMGLSDEQFKKYLTAFKDAGVRPEDIHASMKKIDATAPYTPEEARKSINTMVNCLYSTDCPICMDELDVPHYNSCGHSFHKECIDNWNNRCPQNGCPTCRKL